MRSLDELPSHRKGDYTEAVVVAELARREIPVLRPVNDNERYDLVISSGDQCYSIQVKTAAYEGDGVTIRGVSQHTNGSGNVYKRYEDDVDFFIGYCHELESMYLLPESDIGSRLFLRTEAAKQNDRTTNWAEQYEFDNNWPPETMSIPRQDGRRVINTLEAAGIGIHEPTTDRPYDLLAESPDGGHCRTVITPGYLIDGRIRFDGKGNVVPGPTETDLVLVHCDELDTLYLVRRDEYDVTISFRVDEPEKRDSRINWAEDYEFDERWPDDVTE